MHVIVLISPCFIVLDLDYFDCVEALFYQMLVKTPNLCYTKNHISSGNIFLTSN